MSVDRISVRRVRSVRRGLLPSILLVAVLIGGNPVAAATDSATVLQLEDRSAEDVTEEWRVALREGLTEAAAGEGVVLCRLSDERPECAQEVLQGAPKLAWKISTSTTIKNSLAFVNIPVGLEVVAGEDLLVPKPGLFVVEETFVLSGERPVGGWDRWLAPRVAGIVGNHPSIAVWFAEVRATPGLATLIPGGTDGSSAHTPQSTTTGVAQSEPDGPVDPESEEVFDWERREDEILQMLIDNRFSAARRAADLFLDDDRVPPDARDRLARLREIAAEREASSVVETPEEPESSEAGRLEEAEEVPAMPPVEQVFDYTFRVRVAQPGQGFLRGTDGRLRLFDGGVSFAPTNQGGNSENGVESWFLRWSQLRAWGEAEGLWDVDHPLEMSSTDGKDIYFAVIDQRGRFRTGDRILSLLSEGAERARQR